jgi:hypothetical protein
MVVQLFELCVPGTRQVDNLHLKRPFLLVVKNPGINETIWLTVLASI